MFRQNRRSWSHRQGPIHRPAPTALGPVCSAKPALIKPEFEAIGEADEWLRDDDDVLAVKIGEEVRAYPVKLLRRHEVVNDVVGGRPIFAAYCILANLGAVYDRKVGPHTLTFAVSGYTYSNRGVWEGRDAFVLWDRESESLWWPPIGRGVSGAFVDTPMIVLEEELWSQTNWGKFKEVYPQAVVLRQGQDLKRPRTWPGIVGTINSEKPEQLPNNAIAPRWGENLDM